MSYYYYLFWEFLKLWRKIFYYNVQLLRYILSLHLVRSVLIILVLLSNARFKWTLVIKFLINSCHLLGLPSNLIKGIGDKLRDANSCCNTKAGITLICDIKWLYLSSLSTKSSIKLSKDRVILQNYSPFRLFWSFSKENWTSFLFWDKDFKPTLLPVFRLVSDAGGSEIGNFLRICAFSWRWESNK